MLKAGRGASMASAVGGSSMVWTGLIEGKKKMMTMNNKGGIFRVMCVSSSSSSSSSSTSRLSDQYRMLRIQPGASEMEVRKAFRQLALQYHPDVCKGSNCTVQFSRINEAYDTVMSSLRSSDEIESSQTLGEWVEDDDEMRGMYDPSWDLWEEWMGFEGACTTDYTSHINPYI